MRSCVLIIYKYDMKHELDRMMGIIKDYKTGYGGVTDSFMRKELEIFAKDYHSEQCNIADVVRQSEQLKCSGCNKPLSDGLCGGCCSDLASGMY